MRVICALLVSLVMAAPLLLGVAMTPLTRALGGQVQPSWLILASSSFPRLSASC